MREPESREVNWTCLPKTWKEREIQDAGTQPLAASAIPRYLAALWFGEMGSHLVHVVVTGTIMKLTLI